MQVNLKTPDTDTDDKRKDETKTRHCLICKDSFLSEWAGERICRKCKSSSAWRTG